VRLGRPHHGEHGEERRAPAESGGKEREKSTRINIEPAELVVAAPAGSWAALEQLLGQMVRVRSEMELVKEEELEPTAAVAEDGGERAAPHRMQ
jgi:hypothetical protein